MSFFGFDTSLPRDRDRDRDREREREREKGQDSLLQASAQEDVEVYTWGEESYDDLADQLQEDRDDFNQDTFGSSAPFQDEEFDLTAGNQTLALSAQSHQPPDSAPDSASDSKTGRNDDKFKSNSLDEFWSTSTSIGNSSSSFANRATSALGQSNDPFGGVSLAPVPGLAPPLLSSSSSSSSNPTGQSRPALTLEEVEAELRSKRSQPQPQPQQQSQVSQPKGRNALTLEEVEAQMLAQRSNQPNQFQSSQMPIQQGQQAGVGVGVGGGGGNQFNPFPLAPAPPLPQFQGLPPHIASLLSQQPPNLSPQQREELLGIQLQQLQLQQSGMLGGNVGMGNPPPPLNNGMTGMGMGMGKNLGMNMNAPMAMGNGAGSAGPMQGQGIPPPSIGGEMRNIATNSIPSSQPSQPSMINSNPSDGPSTPKAQHRSQPSQQVGVEPSTFLSNPAHFPPLGTNPTILSRPMAPPMSSNVIPPQLSDLSNASANAALLQAKLQREESIRMKNLLISLPKKIQERILLEIPPYVQFETLDMLVATLPPLVGLRLQQGGTEGQGKEGQSQSQSQQESDLNLGLDSDLDVDVEKRKKLTDEIKSRLDLLESNPNGGNADVEKSKLSQIFKKLEILNLADGIIDSIIKREKIRKRIAEKIQAMSRYNKLMTTSDKDFITRIQVSQLVTSDPYADDFYAHIYFALRGGGPGASVAAASAGITSGKQFNQSNADQQQPPRGPRNRGGRQQRGGRIKETAMQRMQAQVERLVANRKARDGERELASIAKAAGATTTSTATSASMNASDSSSSVNDPSYQPPSEENQENGNSNSKMKKEKSININSSTPSSPSPSNSNLGKVTSSSSKNPRQLLQISAREVREERLKREGKLEGVTDGSATEAVRAALAGTSLGEGAARAELNSKDGKREPLTKFETLRILENLYDLVMALEQMRRSIPQARIESSSEFGSSSPSPSSTQRTKEDYEVEMKKWQEEKESLTSNLWKEFRILEPLEISNPHPFVSLLSTFKGKKIFPRAMRHFSNEQILTSLTMIVASFDSLDVVKLSPFLDLPDHHDPSPRKSARDSNADRDRLRKLDARRQIEAFNFSIVPTMLTEIGNSQMRIVCGMLALFVERNDILKVAQSKSGIALLTMFLSRGELLRQGGSAASGVPNPTPEELDQWVQIFSLLFSRLCSGSDSLVSLFPSTRMKKALPFGQAAYFNPSAQRNIDLEDEPVWNFMATLAISSSMEQQHLLVQQLREKILENVLAAKKERESQVLAQSNINGNSLTLDQHQQQQPQADVANDLRIRNVNLLLHALNLDASQITA